MASTDNVLLESTDTIDLSKYSDIPQAIEQAKNDAKNLKDQISKAKSSNNDAKRKFPPFFVFMLSVLTNLQ